MINNVTLEKLEEKFGKDEAFRRFSEIARLGGYGTPSRDHKGGMDPAYRGGLDLKGLYDVQGEDRLSDATLAKIQELAGSNDADATGQTAETASTENSEEKPKAAANKTKEGK